MQSKLAQATDELLSNEKKGFRQREAPFLVSVTAPLSAILPTATAFAKLNTMPTAPPNSGPETRGYYFHHTSKTC